MDCCAQNGLGLALAGALGGFVVIQKKSKESVQEELSQQISSEQQAVDDLRRKVRIALFLAPRQCALRTCARWMQRARVPTLCGLTGAE